jgi:hypothetical protein
LWYLILKGIMHRITNNKLVIARVTRSNRKPAKHTKMKWGKPIPANSPGLKIKIKILEMNNSSKTMASLKAIAP